MNFEYDLIDTLNVYLCETRSATIHNLKVAQSYFSGTSKAYIFAHLLTLVGSMSNYEFERWYNKRISEPHE
jgi:hypothetical protein